MRKTRAASKRPLVGRERLQGRPQALLDGIPAWQGRTRKQLRQPYADKPPARREYVGRMRQHGLLQMTENRAGYVSRSLATPPRYIVIIKIGIAGTDGGQIGNRPPFPEGCLRHVKVRPIVLKKQPFGFIDGT